VATWVLIITLFAGHVDVAPIGITSVPGYASQGACMGAALWLEKSGAVDKIKFTCIPGPPDGPVR
jgi:hypothetical protein